MDFTLVVLLLCLVATAAAQTTERNEVCGETSFYGPSGVISSPNFPGDYYDYLDCDYDVYAPEGSSLSFVFSRFDTQEDFDVVTISCPTNSSFTPQEYSGFFVPVPISIPWCSQGRVSFRSDESIVSIGFSLTYYVHLGGCGNTTYAGSNGHVTSPNWPNNYGENQNCSNIIWTQWMPQPNSFYLSFHSFELQNNCSSDWLEIRCLDTWSSSPSRHCGTLTNYTLVVRNCTQVMLWFHSDNSENHQGFNIEYNFHPDGVCGNTSFYGPSGIISSPNHPGFYFNDMHCDYTIYASTGSSISIVFTSFNIDDGYDYVTISCPTNSSFLPQEYTGFSLPDPVSIPWCSQGLVNLRSDYSRVFYGFRLVYSVSEGDKEKHEDKH